MYRELRKLRSDESSLRAVLQDADASINRAAHAVILLKSEGVRTLQALADAGEIDPALVTKALAQYRIDDPTAVADVAQEGGDA